MVLMTEDAEGKLTFVRPARPWYRGERSAVTRDRNTKVIAYFCRPYPAP